ncbi:2Fe-2S iron-sulfur cluster-binding protein [Vibrio gangliei]|uniref:2Fe-2S iron-sulfur cluster-binding protein n=1 Tax=Vibrio gangliei TaxID=2077090 RepID=UPI000D01C000|nr:2Fe-2S iron-sulfur cluster-binding protein [Vibrio gangliei]
MIYNVLIKPDDIEFEVDSHQTILSAALEQGVSLAHRCKIGGCMSCLCRKLEGEVEYQLEPMLTAKEQQQGWILPCQAYAKSHLILTMEE